MDIRISEYQDVDISAQHAYRRISEYQVAVHQGNIDSSEIVHALNLKNKIGAGYALILSLRNSGAR